MTVRCSENGGKPWREVTSEHFVVKTDLDSSDAREAALVLERYRRALAHIIGIPGWPPGRMEAVVFSEHEALKGYFAENLGGLMVTSVPLLVSTAVPDRWRYYDPDRVHIHELAHFVTHYRLRSVPRWLSEGLATYLETLLLEEPGDTAVVGKAPSDELAFLRWEREPLPLETLWDWKGFELDPKAARHLYASSWLWVTVVRNAERARFDAFLERLARGEAPRPAWEAEFPRELEAELQQRVLKTVTEGYPLPQAERVRVPRVTSEVTERPLTPAEFHVLAARMWTVIPSTLGGAERAARARVEIGKALRHDPDCLEARLSVLRMEDTQAGRERAVRALVELHPQSGWVWYERAKSLEVGTAERDQALARAASLSRDDDSLLNSIAWEYVLDQRGKEALSLIEAALQFTPWKWALVDTHAAALALSDRCAEAVEEQRRAIQMSGGSASEEVRVRLLRYEEGCKAPPVTPAERASSTRTKPRRGPTL